MELKNYFMERRDHAAKLERSRWLIYWRPGKHLLYEFNISFAINNDEKNIIWYDQLIKLRIAYIAISFTPGNTIHFFQNEPIGDPKLFELFYIHLN